MADIVNSLFGLAPNEVIQARRAQDLELGKLFAGNSNDPAERIGSVIGAQLGGTLGRAALQAFGIPDIEMQRAQGIQATIAEVQNELGEDITNPQKYYPALINKLAERGFTQEAFRLGQVAEKNMQQPTQQERQTDLAYKQSMIDYNQLLMKDKQAEVRTQEMEQKGMAAYGFLNQYGNSQSPEVQEKIWNNAMATFEKMGMDTGGFKDLPATERQAALQSVVDASLKGADRTRLEIQDLKTKFAQEKLDMDNRFREAKMDLQMAIANQKEQLALMAIGSREAIAAQNKVSGLEATVKRLDLQNAWATRGREAAAINSKEANKSLRVSLKESLGLEGDNLIAAGNAFNRTYGDLLSQKDSEGYPKYNSQEAYNMAMDEIEKKVQTEKGWFRDKSKFDPKAKTNTAPRGKAETVKPVIKLD